MTITAKNVVAQVAVKKSVYSGQLGVTSATILPSQFCIFVLATKNVSPTTGVTNDHLRTWLVGTAFQLVKLREYTNAAGGVGQGITVSMWLYPPDRRNSNASGANFFAAYSTTLDAHAFIGYAFECDAGYMVDISTATDLANVNSDPGSMTLNTALTAEHMWLYGLGGDTDNTADLTPDNFWTQFAKATTTGGAADSNIAVRGMYKYGWANTQSANPSLAVADWSATMVTLREFLDKFVWPSNETLFDNFDRANAAQIVNGTWGAGGVSDTISNIGISSEQLYQSGASSGECITVEAFGPDLDIIVQFSGAVTSTFTIYYSLATPGSSSVTGIQLQWLLNFTRWGFSTVASGGSTTGFGNSSSDPKPASSDKLWIAKRGTTHTAYIMRDYTYHWKELCTGETSSYNRAGPIGIRTTDKSVRLQNMYGINVGTGPVVSTLLDDFNRATDYVFTGNPTLWTNKSIGRLGVGNELRTSASSVLGSTNWGEGSTVVTFGPDVDFCWDVTTKMSGEEITFFWALQNAGTANVTGYALRHSYSTGEWRLLLAASDGTRTIYPTLIKSEYVSVPNVGDSIWVSQRGFVITAYTRSAGTTTWTQLIQAFDFTYNRAGTVGFIIGAGLGGKYDNFRGGTVPFQNKVTTLI